MKEMRKEQYLFVHWSLLIVTIIIFIASIFVSFRLVNPQVEAVLHWTFFILAVGLYLFEKQLLISRGRKVMYILSLTASVSPILSNIHMLGDFVVMFGASLLLISLSFPLVISFMTISVTDQPSILNGKLTPLLLGIMSAIYNFCQFALLS